MIHEKDLRIPSNSWTKLLWGSNESLSINIDITDALLLLRIELKQIQTQCKESASDVNVHWRTLIIFFCVRFKYDSYPGKLFNIILGALKMKSVQLLILNLWFEQQLKVQVHWWNKSWSRIASKLMSHQKWNQLSPIPIKKMSIIHPTLKNTSASWCVLER